MSTATVFDIGSTSKQFAAMATLLLAADGRLSLDDDIRRHLPEMPDYGEPITIRQLLTHTSGLRDYITLLLLAGWQIEDVTTPRQALDVIRRGSSSAPDGRRASGSYACRTRRRDSGSVSTFNSQEGQLPSEC